MKSLKTIAIAAVATFGIGGAVVASNNTNSPNVMNTAPAGQPEHWEPLTGTAECVASSQRACIGYEEFPGATVTDIQRGSKKP